MRYLLNYRMFENVDENKYSVIVTETSKNRYVAELKYEDDPKFGKIAKGGCRISVDENSSQFDCKIAYLWAFEVQEKNSGLGSFFLKNIIKYFRENKKIDIKNIVLDVMSNNLPAKRLYQKFGFKLLDTNRDIDDQFGTPLRMYLEI